MILVLRAQQGVIGMGTCSGISLIFLGWLEA